MTTATSIELSCAHEIPFKLEITSFLSKIFFDGISRIIPQNPLLSKRFLIVDALRGHPLYVHIKLKNIGLCVDRKFIRRLKSFFKRDVMVEMHLKKGEITLVLF